MKKQLSLIFSFCAIILFAACDKTETFDDQWKNANEAQFADITADSEYTRINSASTSGYIMYKELKSGDGETPYFTDRVRVLYTGWFKTNWSLPDTYENNLGQTIINKKIFDSTDNRNNIPSTFAINPRATGGGLIEGFSTALQHMQVGDKWEIWIPWNLGYGSAGNGGDIKPYTTLVFEVELMGIL
ncbi:FKBP-type peptidyl-prolyl cis-trans isomerase [Proteiniphilum acetatigenes]|uniref:FKBP-type peptidyl-prolyl cis-trans isomerase n=1 Tax=Proteiniphilum acetatigenes TaxID=294710 RepID=UPI000377447B|nr:FKBP-type peptidyl-prolyl cis-trans isomerase [Proteiniphilum acetatigenes]SFK49167.1 peptidylprolyl isomerase/FKBP-type peptidyl-prolyl cis-trans isomerase FklB [Porphyromonadaceae bacterium KH3CP3RA]